MQYKRPDFAHLLYLIWYLTFGTLTHISIYSSVFKIPSLSFVETFHLFVERAFISNVLLSPPALSQIVVLVIWRSFEENRKQSESARFAQDSFPNTISYPISNYNFQYKTIPSVQIWLFWYKWICCWVDELFFTRKITKKSAKKTSIRIINLWNKLLQTKQIPTNPPKIL